MGRLWIACDLQKNVCNEEAHRNAVNRVWSDVKGKGEALWTNSLSRE